MVLHAKKLAFLFGGDGGDASKEHVEEKKSYIIDGYY